MTPHVTFAINEIKNRKRMRPPSSYIPWAGALRILPSQFFVHLPLKNSTITRPRIFSILGKFLSGKDYPFDERFYFCVFFKCRRNDTSQCKIMREKNYLSYLRKWKICLRQFLEFFTMRFNFKVKHCLDFRERNCMQLSSLILCPFLLNMYLI